MRTTQFNYVSELPLFSRAPIKQIISILLLIYVGITLDFGIIVTPLATNDSLIMNDVSLLAGLLTILFLTYSLIIQLKKFTVSRLEPVGRSEQNGLNEVNTDQLYFWAGSACCLLFILV